LGSPLTFVTIGLHATPSTYTQDSLQSPAHELTAQVLREDPKALYLELMSRWSQLPIGAEAIQLAGIRPIDREPSDYVEAAHHALSEWVRTVAGEEGGVK
jgi:hypothetical protein